MLHSLLHVACSTVLYMETHVINYCTVTSFHITIIHLKYNALAALRAPTTIANSAIPFMHNSTHPGTDLLSSSPPTFPLSNIPPPLLNLTNPAPFTATAAAAYATTINACSQTLSATAAIAATGGPIRANQPSPLDLTVFTAVVTASRETKRWGGRRPKVRAREERRETETLGLRM